MRKPVRCLLNLVNGDLVLAAFVGVDASDTDTERGRRNSQGSLEFGGQ